MAKEPYKLNCILVGHKLDVRALATFRNGTIVSASRDKTARVWTPNPSGTEYTETCRLTGHANFVSSVCAIEPSELFPNGLVITGSNDNQICIYILGETEPIERIKAHENTVCNLRAGHEKGTFLSSSWDCSAKLWDIRNLAGAKLTFVGHTAAVWCVTDLASGLVVTGSADKTVIVWKANSSILHKLTGHADCVRDVVAIGPEEFLTCANDATIRHWNATLGTCLGEFSGHENYIYSISSLPGGSFVVTSSEDRTLRVWRNGTVDEIIALPAQSIWCVELLANGDIVAGASDCNIRIFTCNPERYAAPAIMAAFEEETAIDQLQAQLSIGNVNISDLPGSSILQQPGAKDGQIKMINENGKAKAYSWSMSERKWNLIGDIMGGTDSNAQGSGKQLYNGEEYDYVFSVDIQDGVPPLKLPYNANEDPWHAAQKFIHRNGLSQMFLDQVANFIVKNSQSVPVLKSDSQFADPFTGASRYVPGSETTPNDSRMSSNAAMPTTDPFTGASRYVPGTTTPNASRTGSDVTMSTTSSSRTSVIPSYIPHVDYLKLEQANLPAILEKLKELNNKRTDTTNRISDEQLESAVRLASDESAQQLQPGAVEVLHTLLEWPDQIVFPSLDVARLAVLRKAVNESLCTEQLLQVARRHITASAVPANQMLTFRLLANMFIHKSGEQLGLQHKDEVLKALLDLKSLGSKNNQVAISTYLLNLIIALNKNNDTPGRTRALNVLFALLPRLNEPEGVFRALVGLGTLLAATPDPDDRNELINAVRQSETALTLLRKTSESSINLSAQNKLANCSKQIIDLII